MNFLTAFLIIFSIAQMNGRMEYEEKAIIGALVKGGANEQILKVDDKILELDGKKITLWADIPEVTKEALDKIEQNAKAEYPDDYTLQKAYIKGAIKTYNDLKK